MSFMGVSACAKKQLRSIRLGNTIPHKATGTLCLRANLVARVFTVLSSRQSEVIFWFVLTSNIQTVPKFLHARMTGRENWRQIRKENCSVPFLLCLWYNNRNKQNFQLIKKHSTEGSKYLVYPRLTLNQRLTEKCKFASAQAIKRMQTWRSRLRNPFSLGSRCKLSRLLSFIRNEKSPVTTEEEAGSAEGPESVWLV